MPSPKPLKLKPFLQINKDYCGPASLKILLSFFKKNYSERELAKLAKATPRFGALHEDLFRAAHAIGGNTLSVQNGTLRDLQYWVIQCRLPVLIGWYDVDYDHYSVVYHLTRGRIYLMDPASKDGTRVMTTKHFLKIWHDFEGRTHLKKINRWFMVVNFNQPLR